MRYVLLLFLLFFTALVLAQSPQFIPNQGQWTAKALYKLAIPSGELYLEKDRFTFVLYDGAALDEIQHSESPLKEAEMLNAHAYQVVFLGANPQANVQASGLQPNYYNYFQGGNPTKWAAHVPAYAELTYQNLYPNIDLHLYQSEENGHLKYDFVVRKRGNPALIRMEYRGTNGNLLKEGALYTRTSVGEIIDAKPISYENIASNEARFVKSSYILEDKTVRFDLPEGYNPEEELIIDPEIIFSTYTGSSANNFGFTATYDNSGNAYGGGIAFSLGYPTQLGSFQATYGGAIDAAISKFSPDGSTLLFSTYLGGELGDYPHSMVANYDEELFVFGRTQSTDFPVIGGCYDTTHNGLFDIYVLKFSPTGDSLLASTFIGGTSDDGRTSGNLAYNYGDESRGEIITDFLGNCYVASSTNSPDFPQTANPLPLLPYGGNMDACVFQLDGNLTNLLWSSYLGGAEDDAVYGLHLDHGLNLYVTGGTLSNDFPTTTDAWQTDPMGSTDGFLTKISTVDNVMLASTYIGTAAYDQSYFVQLDKEDNVYVFGQTEGSMPVIGNVFFNVEAKQYITKYTPELDSVIWSSTFGIDNHQRPELSPTAFLVDLCGRIYVSGWGTFPWDMPLTTDSLPTGNPTGGEFYLGVFEKDMTGLLYGSYFGDPFSSEHVDGGTSRFDKRGVVYQAVCASCGSNSSFPTTPNAWSTTKGAGANCNLALFKIDFENPLVIADFLPTDGSNTLLLEGCNPLEVNFSDYSLGSDSIQYHWDFGDGTTSSEPNPTHIYMHGGTYEAQLVVIDPTSCNYSDTLTRSIEVTVSAYADAGPDRINCTGDSLLLEGSGGVSYQWSPSAGLSDTTIANPLAFPDTPTTYYLSIDGGICAEGDSMTIIPGIPVDLTTTPDTFLCIGVPMQLSATGADSVIWSPDYWLFDPTDANPISQTPVDTTYIVRGTNDGLCWDEDSVHIHAIERPSVELSGDSIACQGQIATLYATGAPSYVWNTGDTDSVLSVYVWGLRTYTVTPWDSLCPGIPKSRTLYRYPQPNAIFDIDTNWGYAPFIVDFQNLSTDADTFRWHFGEGRRFHYTFEPRHTYAQSGEYWVQLVVTSQFGCKDTVGDKIFVDDISLFVPNAFSPNGDDHNEYFFARHIGMQSLQISIFDRWGKPVFESTNPNFQWDGTRQGRPLPEGVYTYVLKALGYDNRIHERTGTLTLIR